MNSAIFEYSDYRSFLRAHSELKRKENKNWSYGLWARKLKLKGTASLTMVINAQRSPGPKLTSSLAEYFNFGEKERRYFLDLVRLEKANNDPHLKVLLMEELKRLSPNKNVQFLDEKTFSAISCWYFYAIRQMCRMETTGIDADWFRDKLLFPVDVRKIRSALKTLQDLNLISFDQKKKKWQASETPLTISSDVQSEAIRRFHEDIITLAHSSIRKFSPGERELRALTLSFDQAKLPEVQSKIREFVDSISKEYAQDGGDSVYQLGVQFFPLTVKEKL